VTRHTFIEDLHKDFEVDYNNRSYTDYIRNKNMNSNNSRPFIAKLTKIMCSMFYTKIRMLPEAVAYSSPLFSSCKFIFVSHTRTGFGWYTNEVSC
jgi:hypothetical protein